MPYKFKPMNQPKKAETDFKETDFVSSRSYHGFGHYVLGGLDVTGEHTEMTAPITFDEQSDIDNGCGVDSLCDPTVGFMQLAEELGVQGAESLSESKTE